VVVHEQVTTHGDIDVETVPGFDPRLHSYHYTWGSEAVGCWPARRRISTELLAADIDGDYGMCIDAHTRFRANWDESLVTLHSGARGLDWLGRSVSDVVLTGAMDGRLCGETVQWMPVTDYCQVEGSWYLGGFMPLTRPHLRDAREQYVPARHFSGGLSFGPFALLHLWQRHGDRIVFDGEEHVMSLEVFRAGWGLFHCRLPYAHMELKPWAEPWSERSADRAASYARKVLHADLGSCDFECGSAGCVVTEHQLLTGLDYRAGRELLPNPWREAIASLNIESLE